MHRCCRLNPLGQLLAGGQLLAPANKRYSDALHRLSEHIHGCQNQRLALRCTLHGRPPRGACLRRLPLPLQVLDSLMQFSKQASGG